MVRWTCTCFAFRVEGRSCDPYEIYFFALKAAFDGKNGATIGLHCLHFKKDLSGVVNSTLMECALLLADYDIYPSQVSRSFALLFFCSFLPFALLRSSVSVRESPAFEGRVTLKNCDRRRSLRSFVRSLRTCARSVARSVGNSHRYTKDVFFASLASPADIVVVPSLASKRTTTSWTSDYGKERNGGVLTNLAPIFRRSTLLSLSRIKMHFFPPESANSQFVLLISKSIDAFSRERKKVF